MTYDNNLSGALFKNEDKQSDKHPDYKGSAEIDNTQYWISAWIKTSKAGQKYMSLSFKPKEAKASAPVKPAPVRDEFDDVLGF